MKKLTKILPIISLALSLVLCFVVSFINSSGDIITQYHSSYFLVKDGWWAFLIFLPICLLSLALGLKQKDRIAIAISLVISLVLVIGSVAFAQQVKKYSFDKIYLSDIETKADIDFPKEACSKLSDARNLIGFRKYSDAIRAHYVPCKYCKPSSSYNVVVSIPIQNERRDDDTIDALKQLCVENGFIYKDGKTIFEIITPIGFWRLNIFSMPIQVHHLSLKHQHGKELHYHKQPRVFLSYKDVFDYILRHDGELLDLVERKKIFVEPKVDANGTKLVLCPLCQRYISNDECYEICCNADSLGTITGVPGLILREEINAGASLCKKCMYH